MNKLLLIVFVAGMTGCAGAQKVSKVLEQAAEIATGPCAEKVAAAVAVCSAEYATK